MRAMTDRFLVRSQVAVVGFACLATPAAAQAVHDHTAAMSGVPQGVPYFCANPSVTSAASGAWSNPATWSTKRVPGAGDKVRVVAGHDVVYDIVSDARLDCVELDGRLSFRTDPARG